MRFFHLSDLHIGKMLNGYGLRRCQEGAFGQIIEYARVYVPDAVLICGDVYDKSIPSGEAVTVFDRFLTELAAACPETEILIISGNHDSAERLAYASSFLERYRIHIAALPPASSEDRLKKVVLKDEWGKVNFYLFPFIRPGYVRHLFEDGVVSDYDSAFRAVLSREEFNMAERNVLLAHQFFVWGGEKPETCDSETAVLTAGGLDSIDGSVLETFDYAALGHIHGPQKVGKEKFRYCGTPFKYSVSEEFHKKSVTMVTLTEKGSEPVIETLPLVCVPEVRRIRGTLKEVKEAAKNTHDYVSITLTDETEAYDFREQLEELFEHILEIRIDNQRTRQMLSEEAGDSEVISPLESFRQFYEAVRHCPLTKEQEKIMMRIVAQAEEEERR